VQDDETEPAALALLRLGGKEFRRSLTQAAKISQRSKIREPVESVRSVDLATEYTIRKFSEA
jgi:hypothetical protein